MIQLNQLTRPDKLKIGQQLRLPGSNSLANGPTAANGTYRVRPGDTIDGIAIKQNLSAAELIRWIKIN